MLGLNLPFMGTAILDKYHQEKFIWQVKRFERERFRK